jgi:hypothetical protein
MVRSQYGDFGPALASEYLAAEHGVKLSQETTEARPITEAGWKLKQRKSRQVHVWRERRRWCGDYYSGTRACMAGRTRSGEDISGSADR